MIIISHGASLWPSERLYYRVHVSFEQNNDSAKEYNSRLKMSKSTVVTLLGFKAYCESANKKVE